jgi:hypothetical protein
MADLAYAAALLLAGLFVVAALAKLRRPSAVASQFAGLGLPASRPLAIAVPFVELALAALLAVVPPAGGPAALAVLAFFTTIVVRALRAGRRVPCGCFGSARQQPISIVEVLRNAFLAVLAGLAVAAPAPRVPGLPAALTVVGAAVAGALVLALVDVRREVGQVWSTTLPGDEGSH